MNTDKLAAEKLAWKAFQDAVHAYRRREIEWTEYHAIREAYFAAADAALADSSIPPFEPTLRPSPPFHL